MYRFTRVQSGRLAGPASQVRRRGRRKQRESRLRRSSRRRRGLLGQNEREGWREGTVAHLPVPVAWLGVVGRRRKLARKRRQNMVVTGDEEDGEQRLLEELQRGGTASPERGGGPGRVAWPGRGGSYRGDQRGSPASSSSGTAARGLPGRATASYLLVGCVGVLDGARGGWGRLHL